jgi:hypothetical protein
MLLRSVFAKVILFVIVTLSLTLAAFADTIRLKDGSIIKGRITGFSSGRFTVTIGEGSRLKQLSFMASEIDSITFDTPDEKPQFTASNTRNNGEPNIVNASTKSTEPPRVIVTDSTIRTNGTVTIASKSPSKKPAPIVVRDTSSNSSPSTNSSGSAPPIAWNVKVLADNTANGWTNSGWVVKKGQRIRISADGQVSLGKGKTSTASGIGDLKDDQKLLKNVPTGALIAVIGDDNNDFLYIGSEREFTAARDGALFLGLNEGYLDDNSGALNVKVEILPDESN